MQAVLDHIESRRKAYVALPLFDHLRTPGADPVQTFAFMRNAAHFVMSFADLNRYCFRDEARRGGWQDDVNAHTYEDDHHWPWYLSDLKTLGLDGRMSFTEALEFLWADANRETRLLSYRLWSLAERATPLERIIIIEAIEATGVVFFGDLVTASRRIPPGRLVRPLIYMADHHFAVEQGHAAGQATHDERLALVALSDADRHRYIELVDTVFDHFIAWSAELYTHAVQDPCAPPVRATLRDTRRARA